ncbi:MAG: hydroxypyruvate isomerase, partial [Acidobacteriaceae bacterium]
MSVITRREVIGGLAAGAALASIPSALAETDAYKRKGRIKQSASRGCYPKMSVDELSAYGAQIGLKAIDLLNPD